VRKSLHFEFFKSVRVAAAGIVPSVLLGVSLQAALAQPSAAQGDTVTWTVQSTDVAKGKVTLTLNGTVRDGWHVYSLKQLPEGPTPLLVTLDANDVAKAGGTVVGSAPKKIHDPAFGLDTQFYESAFTVTVPVRLGSHVAAGPQSIPLSVRFQTCNGRVCQPPKTVHLTASINPPMGG
jgi:DsbC/DsbD-like thiol-disulfide interchange protein